MILLILSTCSNQYFCLCRYLWVPKGVNLLKKVVTFLTTTRTYLRKHRSHSVRGFICNSCSSKVLATVCLCKHCFLFFSFFHSSYALFSSFSSLSLLLIPTQTHAHCSRLLSPPSRLLRVVPRFFDRARSPAFPSLVCSCLMVLQTCPPLQYFHVDCSKTNTGARSEGVFFFNSLGPSEA